MPTLDTFSPRVTASRIYFAHDLTKRGEERLSSAVTLVEAANPDDAFVEAQVMYLSNLLPLTAIYLGGPLVAEMTDGEPPPAPPHATIASLLLEYPHYHHVLIPRSTLTPPSLPNWNGYTVLSTTITP